MRVGILVTKRNMYRTDWGKGGGTWDGVGLGWG